ncbi:uncharacterized protein LOC110281604 [Arachis duranensis]|uniref:Uncharacterized protein LOC110281604 n=1 Tax=Arachis duranensis TaxID=130453 RepID=A0A6P5NTT3_ARADU|nr:uncharacterized protein LOC110281604 [Arachis duranensis]
MASEESFVILVHHRGSIKRKTRSGVKFTDKDPLCIVVTPRTSYDDLVRFVLMKLGLEDSKRVKKFFYRIPITVLQDTVKYDCFTISSDEDLQVMFLCRRQFPEVRTLELLAKLVDVPVVQAVASPSFAVGLNGSVGDDVGSRENLPDDLLGVAPLGVGDGVLGDADEDDVEPDMIDDDSGDDIGASEPALAVGGSSTGTQQYPPHFSSLDLDAMRQDGVSGHSVGFRARDAEGTAGLSEFQVGQQFQDKDEALLSVKTYSIRRGVQYKVVESDYRRYMGKCSEFGNGCTWLIRLSLRQRKGIWEVKRYNGPHTCLATSISSDHRSLDYHVISAFIMPMVRADASAIAIIATTATYTQYRHHFIYFRCITLLGFSVLLYFISDPANYAEEGAGAVGVTATVAAAVDRKREGDLRELNRKRGKETSPPRLARCVPYRITSQPRPTHHPSTSSCVSVEGGGARTRAMKRRSRGRAVEEKPPLPSRLAAAATAEVTVFAIEAEEREKRTGD